MESLIKNSEIPERVRYQLVVGKARTDFGPSQSLEPELMWSGCVTVPQCSDSENWLDALHQPDKGLSPRTSEVTGPWSDGLVAKALLFDNSIGNGPRYATSEELAKQLNVSVHAIRKWRQQGRISPHQFGRSVRYVVDEVVAALTRKGRKR